MYRQLEKKLVKQQYLPYMSSQYGELGPLVAEIVSLVWGTPGNFNGFHVLTALLHGTLVMVALWNRADHYIFALWLLLSSFFIPRLISAAADWMSAILPHMVWPYTVSQIKGPTFKLSGTLSNLYQFSKFLHC